MHRLMQGTAGLQRRKFWSIMSYEIRKINDYISYIPAEETPLSSQIGIVYGEKATYLFDVGSSLGCLEFLHGLNEPFDIVCSHFHGDHIWWLTDHKKGDEGVREDDNISINYEKPHYRNLYVSNETKKHTLSGTVVEQPIVIYDKISVRNAENIGNTPEVTSGDVTHNAQDAQEQNDRELKIEIIPCPSSHCKGALIMVVNDEFIFSGDSTYCKGVRNGAGDERPSYNVQLLKAQLELLNSLKADKILLSHDRKFVRPKKVAIRELEAMYSKRIPGENMIYLG